MFDFIYGLSKKHIIITVILVILLGLLTYYIYNNYLIKYVKKNYVSNTEFINEQQYMTTDTDNNLDLKSADFYYFYTNWCPHSKSATPIINELKQQIEDNNNTFNSVYINFVEVDCEKDKKLADKFSVEGYPTIKLVYNSKVYEYDAKPNLNTLNEFLKSVLE